MHILVPSLSRTRLREAYDSAEVDEFITATLRELSGGVPDEALAKRISNACFKPVRIRPGYDMREVDDYLDALHVWALTGRQPQ